MIQVSEVFGPTVQGEGSAAGQHCLFLRLFGCNLECRWCDTPYTWAVTPEKAEKHDSKQLYTREEQCSEMSVSEVVEALDRLWPIRNTPTNIVVSGGEPLIQGANLIPLFRILYSFSCDIHVETAGTIRPLPELDRYVYQYNISPKLFNSGNMLGKRIKPVPLRFFADHDKAWFKFVVSAEDDLDEIDEIVKSNNIPVDRVMVMPEGTSTYMNVYNVKKVAQAAIDRGYGISMRTHILIWEDERGR